MRQTTDIFNLGSQSLHADAKKNCTGLGSEEKLVEEAVLVTELLLISKMLASLIRFDVSQSQKVPSVLKKVESELSDCVNFCRHTLEKLTRFQSLFESSTA